MKHKIVITRHRPWLKTALLGGSTFALAVAGWGLYSYTRAKTVSDFERSQLEVEQLRTERRDLTRDLRAARAEVAQLKDQVTYVQRSQEIDSQACGTVRESLAGLQTEVSELREQLAFYRSIVSPDQSRAGVRVHELRVQPAGEAAVYRYDLVLIQSVRHDRRIGGKVLMQVQGLLGGQMQTLDMERLAVGGAQNLVFSFKYFEEFSGDFRLPAGFTPTRITVALEPEGGDVPRIEDGFDWAKVTNGGGA